MGVFGIVHVEGCFFRLGGQQADFGSEPLFARRLSRHRFSLLEFNLSDRRRSGSPCADRNDAFLRYSGRAVESCKPFLAASAIEHSQIGELSHGAPFLWHDAFMYSFCFLARACSVTLPPVDPSRIG